MKRHLFILMLMMSTAVLLSTLSSCSGNEQSPLYAKPHAFGTVNKVNVLMDDKFKNSLLRDTLKYFYAAPYPILPQAEPQYDLRFISAGNLLEKKLGRELRAYLVLVDMSDTLSDVGKMAMGILSEHIDLGERGYSIKIVKDHWAKGQRHFFVMGKDTESLYRAIAESFPSLSAEIRKFDQKLIKSATYLEGENKTLSKLLGEKHNLSIKIPGKYINTAVSNDTVTWMQFIQENAVSSLIVHQRPYKMQSQFDKEYVRAWTDSIIGEFVSTDVEGSYMKLNGQDLPIIYQQGEVQEHFYADLKAIWEMENAFMGGALVSRAIYKSGSENIHIII